MSGRWRGCGWRSCRGSDGRRARPGPRGRCVLRNVKNSVCGDAGGIVRSPTRSGHPTRRTGWWCRCACSRGSRPGACPAASARSAAVRSSAWIWEFGRPGARFRPFGRSVSPSRLPNRTCTFPRIRLSTGMPVALIRWSAVVVGGRGRGWVLSVAGTRIPTASGCGCLGSGSEWCPRFRG